MAELITLRDTTGAALELSGPYRLSAHSGLGMPAPRLLIQRDAYVPGHRTVEALWEGRVVQLVVELLPGPGRRLAQDRDPLYAMLAQLRQGAWLRVEREDGVIRESRVRLLMELPADREARMGDGWQRLVLTLASDEPWWYGEPVVRTFAVSAGEGRWAYPLGFPAGFGGSIVDTTESFHYLGHADAYPILRLYGPAEAFVVENLTLGTVLDLSAFALGPGEVVVFDLREGAKTVTLVSSGESLVQYLSDDSHLGTWRLGAHPEPSGGVNTIHVYLEDATNETQFAIEYRPRYLGV